MIGEKLALKREATFAKNLEEFAVEELYFITEEQNLFEGVQKITFLPKGTIFEITSATFHKNGTSGITTSNIVGTVFVKELNKEMKFEYSWGQLHFLYLEEPCDYWTFPKAIWQDNEDTKKYFIK